MFGEKYLERGLNMSGINLRLKKLFKGKKNLVISGLDHVMEYGDQPGIEDARKAIKNCLTTDALLVHRFMLKRNWDLFGSRVNTPMPVVRINWTSSFYYPLDYREGNTTIATTVEEAVAAGAQAVICSLSSSKNSEHKDDIEYILDIIDWDLNVLPNFKEKFYLEPINIEDTTGSGYQEKWIIYGKIDGIEVFSSKELTIYPGGKATIKDTGAYGLITIQGYGTINDIDIESPTMIRFGDITRDEFFVPYPTARAGVTVENKGYEPLVILKFFGPDCNPDMPGKE